jgi:HEXXH motif-containing protein
VRSGGINGITGEELLPALPWLRSAELGKHEVLLAAIMRMAPSAIPGDYERALLRPYQLLRDIEVRAPRTIAALLATPQFGAWGDRCLRRLLDGEDSRDPPLATDLGHLALFAATAAMRAGNLFRLEVPLRDGSASLPTLGTARPGASTPWEWGAAWRDGHGCRLGSGRSTVEILLDCQPEPPAAARWSALPRIVRCENGLLLDVLLDDGDPCLDRYGIPRKRLNDEDLTTWGDHLTHAWAILTADHYPLAELIAGTVQTLVPLARPTLARSVSATEVSAFGAVALSLTTDSLSLAEALVHEVHHGVLGAVTDIQPLVEDGTDVLAYAPWRDDPRPGGALLHGVFAHYGMGRFWCERYRTGPAGQRPRAAIEFARMRAMAARGLASLDESGLLTVAGQEFLAGLRAVFAAWLRESLPADAEQQVAELNAGHEVRWRVTHLVPAADLVVLLADAWRAHQPPPVSFDTVPTRLEAGPISSSPTTGRSYLRALRIGDPGLMGHHLAANQPLIDQADAALIPGEDDAAEAGYLDRITAGKDPEAWAGLAIVRRRTAPALVARVFLERPELLMALHGVLRDEGGTPDALANWLAP